MATLEAIVGSTNYTISGGGTTYRVFLDGGGLPPIRRLIERGPLQHGAFDLGYRVDVRTLRLMLAYSVSSASAAVTRRDALYAIFAPGNGVIRLRETRDDSSVRQIDCHVVGVMDMPQSERTEGPAGTLQQFLITLQAADPFWYDPVQQTASATGAATVAWRLAQGTIDSSAVEEYVTSPSQGQNWTATLDTLSNFSIGLRTSKNSADASKYAFISYYSSNYHMYLGGDRFRYRGAGVNWDVSSIWPDTSAHNIIITATYDAGYTFGVWRDGTLVATSTPGWTAYSFAAITQKWRSDQSGANTWTDAITRAAIYNIALSDSQVTALNSTLTSGDTTNLSMTVNYGGSAEEYPLLVVTGPITSPIITNGATGLSLDFTGYTVASGTTLMINTAYGYKTVVDSAGVNRIDKLVNASNLATWRFLPGNNGISMTGGSTDSGTKLDVNYYRRYWGA